MADVGLELRHDGNPSGRTIFFVHGWPDDPRIWEPQIRAFGDRWNCVRVTLPGYGERDDAPEGMDFPEIADRIANAIEASCVDRGEEQVVLIGHDWGAHLSYFVERAIPSRIERFVTLDVGGRVNARDAKTAAGILAYQLPLVGSWVLRRVAPALADRIAVGVARAVRAPLENRARPLDSRTSYPYYYLWRSLVHPAYRDRLLRRYEPTRPLLYMYALRKPFMFHSPGWIAMLEARPDCEVVAIDSDHWMTIARPDEVNAAIERFIAAPPMRRG